MLLAYSDCSSWLITTVGAVRGEHYANAPRDVIQSSINPNAHQVRWYNRLGAHEDPWISVEDHHSFRGILYGQASFSLDLHTREKNQHGGANVYIRDRCSLIDNGGWSLVRHTKGTGSWGPFKDGLAGTDVVGSPAGPYADGDWTLPWTALTSTEMLLAYSDCSSWLITTVGAVRGDHYANAPRAVIKSSINPNAHAVRWYNRLGAHEDPWVSVEDHHNFRGILYGQASFSLDVHTREKNQHGGANVYIRDRCSLIDNGGWTLVRHTKGTGSWGPFKDGLAGTDVVGSPAGPYADGDWTVPWTSASSTEMLLAYGDCSSWLITTVGAVRGEKYANAPRDVIKSSINPNAHQVRWYNRLGAREDPWISVEDHHNLRGILYGQASFSLDSHTRQKNQHGGANVYIRDH